MNDNNNFSIEIQYKILDEISWKKIILSPDLYFDLDDDEEIEVDSVPKYLSPLNYIEGQIQNVQNIKILINDFKNKASRTLFYTYWNNQRSFIAERIDYINDVKSTEIVISADIQENSRVTDILRAIRKDGVLVPIYHGIIKDNPDGSQEEFQQKLY